jgi:hypothetical protein
LRLRILDLPGVLDHARGGIAFGISAQRDLRLAGIDGGIVARQPPRIGKVHRHGGVAGLAGGLVLQRHRVGRRPALIDEGEVQ